VTGNSRRRCARGADRPKRPEGTEWSGLPCEGFADCGYDFGGERADLSGVVSFGPDDETVHPDGAYERDKVLGPLGGGPLERAGRLRLDDTGDVVDPADRVRIAALPGLRRGCGGQPWAVRRVRGRNGREANRLPSHRSEPACGVRTSPAGTQAELDPGAGQSVQGRHSLRQHGRRT
jgi:hypothetical protein